MEKIIVANLKMNLNYYDIKKYIEKLNKVKFDNIELFISPSLIYLNDFLLYSYKVTAQNVSYFENGSYTGEVSAEQLKSIGVSSVLIGHYERRSIFNENLDIIKQKIRLCLKNKINVILCVGTKEKNKEQELKLIIEELDYVFKDNNINNNIIIAYEPYDMINSDKIVNIDNIKYIYNKLKNKYNVKIIYGGNVNKDNIIEICNITDGVIVGKMCLNEEEFINSLKKIH